MRGHIETRSASSHSVVIELDPDPMTGKRKRIYRAVKGGREEAEIEMAAMITDLQRGTYVEPERTLFADFLRRWLEENCKPRLRPKTIQGYGICIENHIVPMLGQIRIKDLRPLHFQSLYTRLLKKGLSKRSVQLVHVVCHAAMKQALRWQMVYRNPVDAVEPPRPEKRKMRALDSEEFLRLIAFTAGTPIEYLVLVAAHTGLRRGELLALQWQDVDFEHAELHVQHGMVKIRGEVIINTPKSGRGRSVPLTSDAAHVLKLLKIKSGGNRYVFAREDGRPLDPSTVSDRFERIAKAAGFEGLRFHDLRHTCASILLENGVHLKATQELLGHSSVSVTGDIYSHVRPAQLRAAADTLQKALRRRFGDDLPVKPATSKKR